MATDPQILAPRDASGDSLDPRRWLTLVVLLLAAFMNLLDISIVNIAIPSIQRDLHASYADVQWALAGYTLAYALVLITGGRLGDAFGRKRLFLIGVTGFTLMSALCGAAQSPGMLIASRVAQGAFGAIMIPQVLSVIQVIFPAAERIKALAAFGVTAGLGTVSGPLLGGLLTQHNLFGLDWRPIFLINVPVGIVAAAAAALLIRESRAPRPPRLDPVGVALISAALLLLLYPLVQGRELGWPAWTFVSMAAAAPMLAVFIVYERAKDRRDGSPLVQLGLFRQRAFAVGIVIAITFFLGVTSFALILTLFLQVGLGFGPLHAGLTFLPFSGGVLIASGAAARLAPKFGRGVTMAGALVMAAGMAGAHRHRAPFRWRGHHLGHGAGARRRRNRHGHAAGAAGRHPARRRADAGRRIGVRHLQHQPSARRLDWRRGHRGDLLRTARQPVGVRRRNRHPAVAVRACGRARPGAAGWPYHRAVRRMPARQARGCGPDGDARRVSPARRPGIAGPGKPGRRRGRSNGSAD